MPPAIAAIAVTAISAGATYAASTLAISALAAALITVGATIAAQLLVKKAGNTNQGAELKLKLDAQMPRQVAVGLTATGGSSTWAYIQNTSSKIPNETLWRVITLSDFPITGVVKILEGKNTLTFSGDVTTGLRECTQHRGKHGKPKMFVRVYLGSFTPTACTDLITATGGVWTANHKGVGTAYMVVKYLYDDNAFTDGEPALVVVMEGAPIYDDRKDGSKPDRTGSHRLDDVSTWEYSTNCANIIAQALRGFSVNGQLIIGVQAEERDLPDESLLAAYNVCDTLIEDSDGSKPKYQAGRMLTASEKASDYLSDLQLAMDGRIYDRGGQITIVPGQVQTPVVALNDDDIIWTDEKSWQPKAEQSSLFNYLTGSFVDGNTGFGNKPYPPLANPAWETEDGGERFSNNIDFNAVFRWPQVQRTTQRIFKSSRFQGVIAFTAPLALLELEQGDWFTLSSARWGFVTKYFQAQYVHILISQMRIAIVGVEVSPGLDDWDYTTDERPRTDDTYAPPDFTLPIPTFTLDSYLDTDGQTAVLVIAVASLDDPDNPGELLSTTVQYYETQIAFTEDLDTAWSGPQIQPDTPTALVTLGGGSEYSVRIRAFDGTSFSAWSDWQAATLPISSQTTVYIGQSFISDDGFSITDADNGTNSTITIPAHTRVYPDKQVTVNAGTVDYAYDSDAWVYYDDGERLGEDANSGAGVTYEVGTTAADSGPSSLFPARHFVQFIHTTTAGGTGGGGSGGGPGWGGACAFIGSHTPHGYLVGNAIKGAPVYLLNAGDEGYHEGYITHDVPHALERCLRITTESGITLIVSDSTPITSRFSVVHKVTESLGIEVPVLDGEDFRWEKIVGLDDMGVLEVALICAGNGTYAAGEVEGRYIFTHNATSKP